MPIRFKLGGKKTLGPYKTVKKKQSGSRKIKVAEAEPAKKVRIDR